MGGRGDAPHKSRKREAALIFDVDIDIDIDIASLC